MATKLDTRQFLEHFFGDGNQIKLDAIESAGGSARMLQPWLIRLEQNLPSVLPCKHDRGTDWYGVAQSDRELRSLREDLTAFVGPTWSTFRGQRAQLDLNNPVEASVQAFTGGFAFKFQGTSDSSGRSREVWQALELMRQVLNHREPSISKAPRATGRVLRDFYMALQASDRSAAEAQLHYLKTRNRLDPQNLLFLKVRMLSDLAAWEELLALPELPDLLGTRRPYEVTQALIRAVYQQELYRFESTKAAQSAVTYFYESIFPQYSNLYVSRSNSRQPETIKSFMLLAIGRTEPDVALKDELLNLPGLNPDDSAYLQQLANLVPTPVSLPSPTIADPLKQAEEANQRFDYDQVLIWASQAPSSLQKVRLLFDAFYDLRTLDSQREALVAFQELSSNDQEIISRTRYGKDRLELLRGFNHPVEKVPGNWVEWFQQLVQNPQWDLALDVARRGEQEWDISDLVTENGAIQQFRTLLETASGQPETEQTLANALPHLLGTFQNDNQYPRREFMSIYAFLLDLIAVTTSGGDPDLVLFNELTNALLSLGINQDNYNEIVGFSLDLWGQYGSPAKVDWILDFISILIIQPCLNKDIRNQLLFTVAATLRQYIQRIDQMQWYLFSDLIRDLNLEASFPNLPPSQDTDEVTEVNLLQKLKNKSVLIYTLTEPVAQRVKTTLESICTGINIHLSHAKGGNDQLKTWILNADLVVVVTASAKHAATYFIEDHCAKDKLLRVNTKGSASLMRELQTFLKENL